MLDAAAYFLDVIVDVARIVFRALKPERRRGGKHRKAEPREATVAEADK